MGIAVDTYTAVAELALTPPAEFRHAGIGFLRTR
jgi:hypothetical protein